MCSIEEAWGSNNTFQEKKVFSQADVRGQYMNTPENLNYPAMKYGPMTKNLPAKNRFSRGVHSKLSRKPRMNPEQYKNRGQNGNVNVNVTPDYSVMNQRQKNSPDYLDLFPKPAQMIPSVENYPLPVKNTVPEPVTTMEEDDFVPWNESFQVSSDVDHFMNSGLNNPLHITDKGLHGEYGDQYRGIEESDDVYHEGAIPPTPERNLPRSGNNTNNVVSDEEELHKQKQEEIVNLLNKILHRVEKLEKDVKKGPTYTKSDIIIYAILSAIGGIVLYALLNSLMNNKKK